ncbi:MAG: sel1 repeat family protein [Lachnospiraceae bacterium]|nr:sel1 repeat family protein [Lachnospiraceae bacterium]
MDESVTIAAGYPHELLGHLRRMDGAENVAYFQDSENLLVDYKNKHGEYIHGVRELEIASKLGIISEMISILSEPMWRKRAFINKSAIRMMSESGFKEYEMVELLESFIQLFGWDIEIAVPRRWETSEEDSAEWYKANYSRKVQTGNHAVGDKAIVGETAGDNDDNIQNQDTYNRDTNQDADNNEYPDNDDAHNKKFAEQKVRDRVSASKGKFDVTSGTIRKSSAKKANETSVESGTGTKSGKGNLSYVDKVRQVDYSQYVEDDEVILLNSTLEVMSQREFIANEIIKSGIKFERIMSSSVKKDVRKAINGNSDAQCRMGAFYAEPDTVHTDYLEAVKWYKVSASQGNSKAQFELGMLYDSGRIKCDDYKTKAIKCYLSLAEAGFPSAQCTMGLKYRFGDGVAENLEESIKWFLRSANQGHVDAQRNLGDIYMGIGKNEEAARWYKRAAASGDAYSAKRI